MKKIIKWLRDIFSVLNDPEVLRAFTGENSDWLLGKKEDEEKVE